MAQHTRKNVVQHKYERATHKLKRKLETTAKVSITDTEKYSATFDEKQKAKK